MKNRFKGLLIAAALTLGIAHWTHCGQFRASIIGFCLGFSGMFLGELTEPFER